MPSLPAGRPAINKASLRTVCPFARGASGGGALGWFRYEVVGNGQPVQVKASEAGKSGGACWEFELKHASDDSKPHRKMRATTREDAQEWIAVIEQAGADPEPIRNHPRSTRSAALYVRIARPSCRTWPCPGPLISQGQPQPRRHELPSCSL